MSRLGDSDDAMYEAMMASLPRGEGHILANSFAHYAEESNTLTPTREVKIVPKNYTCMSCSFEHDGLFEADQHEADNPGHRVPYTGPEETDG